MLALAVAPAVAGSADGRWPPFLPPPEAFSTAVEVTVRSVWTDPTLHRRVAGPPARVSFERYTVFLDTPDLTAAAARHLRLARYEVEALGRDWYRATDNDGARGIYAVLAREPHRRVLLSWGQHTGYLLGTITGSALTVIDLVPGEGRVEQSLSAWVRIENAAVAALARLLVRIFGHLADRKLGEGFEVTVRVAEWADSQPEAFCRWLAAEPFPPGRRRQLLAVFPECA